MDTRQKGNGGTRGAMFAECRNLPSVFHIFAECRSLQSVFSRIAECQNGYRVFFSKALDKQIVCRVPESLLSVRYNTLGKEYNTRQSLRFR